MPADDYYTLLGIQIESTTAQINKAYRKLALRYHPDKVGKDDTAAVDMFMKLKEAVDILLDPTKRKEYDDVYKAEMAQKVRAEKLDSDRRKRKEDLEDKEQAAKRAKMKEQEELSNQEKIERLRKENLDRMKDIAEESRKTAERAHAAENNILTVKPKKGVPLDVSDVKACFGKFGKFDLTMLRKSYLLVFENGLVIKKILEAAEGPELNRYKISVQSMPDDTQMDNIMGTQSTEYETDILRSMRMRDKARRKLKSEALAYVGEET
ncbi:hypothetical protein HDU97_010437 [Phlyctochytrium planicorne]|nr:hypothetical protein HDU97_010437 [Phlyctochytrium planicorne]